MIIVKLKGGLGNQMFQYAFARRIAEETGLQVKMDTAGGFYNDYFGREYKLDKFDIILHPASDEELVKHSYYSSNIAGRIYTKTIKMINYYNGYEIKERECFSLDLRALEKRNDRYYDGYWQHTGYFERIKNDLIKEFSLCRKSNRVIRFEEEIGTCNSVGIHIRTPHALTRGGIEPETLGKFRILNSEYYRKAILKLKEIYGDAELFVFAENETYAAGIMKEENCHAVICGEDYEDFYLLSRCRHQIIANSTFSWWAAWLNTNNGKTIISPERWFNYQRNEKEALLRDFILVE